MRQFWERRWVRWSVYGWWTSLVFVLSLVWTYPSDALVAEVEAAVHQAGVLKSFEASGVVVRSGRGAGRVGGHQQGDEPTLAILRVWVSLKGLSSPKPNLRFAVDAYKGSYWSVRRSSA